MKNFEDLWKGICQIYFLTKHYLLLAEEISENFDTFIQPIKEHRDVLDHITRVYGFELLKEKETIVDIDGYKKDNMKKALGHAYRSFFDTADWLTYVCRQEIRKALTGKSYELIVEKYPKYCELKALLIELPEKIAAIREHKDMSDKPEDLIKQVNEYVLVMDDLIKAYKEINQILN
jgi:hypothetical protein